MIAVDCHCHLEDDEFDKDREEVIARAVKKNIIMISSGLGLEHAKKVLQISNKYKEVSATIGIEPYSKQPIEPVIDFIKQNAKKIIGIGEVGLDFYWAKKENLDKQIMEKTFVRFIQLAQELELPLITHSRSAGLRTIELLTQNSVKRVMMHAFDGRASSALKGVDMGFYFSIPPCVVRSEQKQEVVKVVPLENLLLETDSPVLGVDPKARNEPQFLFESAKKIAEIKGLDLESVIETTTENAKNLFKIKV